MRPRAYLHEFLLLLLPVLVAAALAAPGGAAAAQTPEPARVGGAAEPPADLESAIVQVRSLYFANDFHHGAAVGDAALERWSESSELAAWTIASLASSWPAGSVRQEEALARAESLVESRPDDVWAAIALAHALLHNPHRRGEALDASLRPLELAPTLAEAVWVRGFVLHRSRNHREAAAFIAEKWPVVDRQWPELLNIRGEAYLSIRGEGSDRVVEGLEMLARVRELDPDNVNAHYLAGTDLVWNRRRVDEGAALLERAGTLSPGSFEIARARWQATSSRTDLDAEEKKALIRAAAHELLEWRGHYPGARYVVAFSLWRHGSQPGLEDLRAEGAALEDRVLAEFAHTEDAEFLLSIRGQRLADDLLAGVVEDTASTRAELTSMLWAFINRPQHQNEGLLGDAYLRLFNHLRRDDTVSPDTLLLLARGAAKHHRGLPHASLATGLAERRVHLDEARQMARDAIEAAEELSANEFHDTPGEAADVLDGRLANAYSAIGYVELKAGDLAAAREAINLALELKPDHSQVQFRAGALAEAEGDLEGAEIHYAWGERLERLAWSADKPNRDALERMYMLRTGSMEGYDEFVAGIEERDRTRRWQRIAESRIAEPRELPAIDLEWLNGGRIAADELEGRIVVINFWGVWCGPCVAEAPQIQQLHEKYRDDPGVVFLTINAYDPDLGRVRTWMADNGYDYPVLVDDNFATPHGVRVYPTTWFVDSNGRIAFEYSGVSSAVFEEFVWRVEMLQAEDGAAR